MLIEVLRKHSLDSAAVISEGLTLTYGDLFLKIEELESHFNTIPEGAVVALIGEHSAFNTAALIILIEKKCVIAPLAIEEETKLHEINCDFVINEKYSEIIRNFSGNKNSDSLILSLKEKNHPGLILFTSGSTGKEKAAVHDFDSFIKKIKIPKKSYRSAIFLKFGHIGGINSLLQILMSGGCAVCLKEKNPSSVLAVVEKYQIELLPLSSSFITMMFAMGAHHEYNLSSLKLVTFGTEPMSSETLELWKKEFPSIKLMQTYGLTETGILKIQSPESATNYMKIVDPNVQTRIREGVLELKMEMSLIGYLGMSEPITDKDGWYNTGDLVELHGDYFRIKGRDSDIVNVSGLKVYPLEIESVLVSYPGVFSAKVFGRDFVLTGQIVVARIFVNEKNRNEEFIAALKTYCSEKMESYKVPVDIEFYDPIETNELKKIRRES